MFDKFCGLDFRMLKRFGMFLMKLFAGRRADSLKPFVISDRVATKGTLFILLEFLLLNFFRNKYLTGKWKNVLIMLCSLDYTQI